MASIFQKFTNHSKNALKNAFGLALNSGQKIITPWHILHGLSMQKGSIAAQILAKTKINQSEIKKILIKEEPNQKTISQMELSPATKKILEKSFLIANSKKHKYIGTEHLLASVIAIKDSEIIIFFNQLSINLDEIKRQVDTILNSTSRFPSITGSLKPADEISNSAEFASSENDYPENYFSSGKQTAAKESSLDFFATDLTSTFTQKNIDPVIGRTEEISRLIQILSRRNKNNPLLLGDPGVGKTAIVEGLAKKIINGEVPEILASKKIYALDLSLIVAGTSFRGEFENRLKQILTEVKKNPNIILFIDEVHNIIGAGSATGSMDAANILKPALARGEIRCIGATTAEEYKKYIESDPALERRFQPIFINQPSENKAIEILEGIKNNYEIFHQVRITSEAIKAAVHLSERYISERFLPDKAIDLIDEASSAIKIKHLSNKVNKELWDLEKNLKNIQIKKQEAVSKEKFNLALKYRQQEHGIILELEKLKEKHKKSKKKLLAEITEKEISEVVSKITGVPLSDLVLKEKNQLIGLEKLLSKKIIAQDEALNSVSEFIRRSRTGISDSNRPIGSFIFLGPSGVGKTETAKVLAETVFGSRNSLIKIDMSEFAESFNISKLIGAPAGYVGYKEGAKLTDAIKHRPYSVILFDEIEKAHRQIFNLLLQILEEGSLTDGTGKKINFRNSIIIMTSNLGSESFNQQAALGFGLSAKNPNDNIEKKFDEIEAGVLKKLKDMFPPEFLSRIDKTIVFKPLNIEAATKITRLQIKNLSDRLKNQNIKIEFEPSIAEFIAKNSYSRESGARAIRKTIQEQLESKIARKILESKKDSGEIIKVKVRDNKIVI